MEELILSVKQYKSLLDHLERIKNDVTILKQKSTGEALLVDTYDLVRLLQVTYRTIQRWRISGRLPFIRLGRRYYYRADQLIDLFKVIPNKTSEIDNIQPVNEKPVEENFEMPCYRCPMFQLMIS
jgi:excisionase family DNA binding protein